MNARRETAACLMLLIAAAHGIRAVESPESARAGQHCSSAKSAAQRAADQGLRAKEFERQAGLHAQELARVDLQIRQLNQKHAQNASRLTQLQNQLRASAQETKTAVQTAQSRFQASRSQIMDSGSSRALQYIENVLASMNRFAGQLAGCAELPASCQTPYLSCPAPPSVAVPTGSGPNSAFIRQVNQSNQQYVQEYYRSCQQAGQSAARTVQELRAAQSAVEMAGRRVKQSEGERQRVDLKRQQALQQAAQAAADVRRLTDEARRESTAADALMQVNDYCRTPLKDYSAQLDALRKAADASGQKTRELMTPPRKDPL